MGDIERVARGRQRALLEVGVKFAQDCPCRERANRLRARPLHAIELSFVDRRKGGSVRLEACGVQVCQIVGNRVLRFLSGSHSLGSHIQSAYHQRALSAQG
jgi:hypothetical protein